MANIRGNGRGREVVTSNSATSEDDAAVLTRGEALPSADGSPSGLSDGTLVRRPFGLNFKKNTYAYLELLRTDNTNSAVPLFNENHSPKEGGPQQSDYTNNFLIQSFNEHREEKYQVVETFGANFVFFFGERPRYVDVVGLLLNANSHRWKREWLLNYDQYLRGTKAVENGAIVNLHVDNITVSGYLLSCNISENAADPRRVQFQFRMIVTDYVFNSEFSGDVENGLTYFPESIENLGKDLDALVPQQSKFDKRMGALVDGVDSALSGASGVVGSLPAQLASQLITQAVFGDPFSLISTSASGAASMYRLMKDNGIDSLLDSNPDLAASLGSLVEYGGKPPELIPVGSGDAGTTLGAAGISRLSASVDNSLNLLLGLRHNPIIQALGVVQEVVENAVNLLGANADTSFIGRVQGAGGVGKPSLAGNFMGFDMVLPIGGVKIVTVGTQKVADVDDPDQGAFGDPNTRRSIIQTVPNDSNSLSASIKDTPVYDELPREWKLLFEKDPSRADEKLGVLVDSSPDGEQKLVVTVQDQFPIVESNLTAEIENG